MALEFNLRFREYEGTTLHLIRLTCLPDTDTDARHTQQQQTLRVDLKLKSLNPPLCYHTSRSMGQLLPRLSAARMPNTDRGF